MLLITSQQTSIGRQCLVVHALPMSRVVQHVSNVKARLLPQMYELHGHSTPPFVSSGCPPTAFNYILNGDLISTQETHRDLAIIVSSDLSWREHEKYSIQSI